MAPEANLPLAGPELSAEAGVAGDWDVTTHRVDRSFDPDEARSRPRPGSG